MAYLPATPIRRPLHCLGGSGEFGGLRARAKDAKTWTHESNRRFVKERPMRIIIELPDELASALGDASEMPRRLLEAFAADTYRTGTLSRGQVRRLLGLDYWQTDEFLTQRDALREYTQADWEIERRSLATIPVMEASGSPGHNGAE